MPPRPAHETKHVPLLHYPFRDLVFHLSQLDNGATNGTALWLGAQCLSAYLADLFKHKNKSSPGARRPRAIELGSGVGLSACVLIAAAPLSLAYIRQPPRSLRLFSSLALASMGWDVLATDLPDVISAVLEGNISRSRPSLPPGSGTVEARVLDWTVPPDLWVWDDPHTIAFQHVEKLSGSAQQSPILSPPFDLVISSDTLYSAELVAPLLRAFHALCTIFNSSSPEAKSPPIYFCVERRDPGLMDRALSEAKSHWNFRLERVPHKRLAKAMEKSGALWEKTEWDDVEIWKMVLRP